MPPINPSDIKTHPIKKTPTKLLLTIVIVIIISVLAVSFPGWNGSFVLDDYPNIVQNQTLKFTEFSFNKLWTATISGISSSTGRPISMLSFALSSYFHGLNPFLFKLTNTIIHLLNTILVFLFSIKLLNLPKLQETLALTFKATIIISFLISLIWAVSPINISSSLYIVQRMNELSFLFLLSACLFYLHIRTSKEYSVLLQILLFFILCILLTLSVLSKENGILTIPLIFLIEYFLLYKSCKRSNQLFYYCNLLFFFIFPIVFIFIYLLLSNGSSLDYSNRDFSLIERMMTQLRILIFYNKQLLFPDIYQLSYINDDIITSTSITKPFSTLYSLIFWCIFTLLSLWYYKKYPWIFFGLVWFLISHSIESTIIPLEMYFEHRNYLPSFGIIFLGVTTLYYIYSKNNHIFPKYLVYLSIICYLIYLIFHAHLSAKIIGNTNLMYNNYADKHPKSIRSQLIWGEINFHHYLKNPSVNKYKTEAEKRFNTVSQQDPQRLAGLIYLILLKQIDNMEIDHELTKLYSLLQTTGNQAIYVKDSRQFIKNNKALPIPLPTKIMDKYFFLLLNNSNIKGMYKGLIHEIYANYLSLLPGKNAQSIYHLQKLVQYHPTINTKLYLVTRLIDAKRYKEANQLLQQVKKENVFMLYSSEIKNIQQHLNKNIIHQ